MQGVIALAALPTLTRARGIAPPGARAAATAAGSGAVPSESGEGGRLTTPVSINGTGPYRFLVDTGAERTVIAEEIAAELRLPPGSEVLVEGIVRSVPAKLVLVERLGLGALTCPRLEVPTLPRAMLEVDGYLGLDVLNGRRVIFDFASHTLKVTRSQGRFAALWTRADEVRVPTLGDSGRLRATDCRIDGVATAAFIDSGAQVTVSNLALFAACQRHLPAQRTFGSVGLSGITGGTAIGQVTLFDKIHFGGLTLTNTPVIVTDLEVFRLWGLRHRPALLMGMNCLRCFERVSIDYGRRLLKFAVPGAAVPAAEPVLQPFL